MVCQTLQTQCLEMSIHNTSPYTLNSVTGKKHVKYWRIGSAFGIPEESLCLIHLYNALHGKGHIKSDNRTRHVLLLTTLRVQ